jgi:hypothetical protein
MCRAASSSHQFFAGHWLGLPAAIGKNRDQIRVKQSKVAAPFMGASRLVNA